MKKLSLMFLVVILLTCVTVEAQKKKRAPAPVIPTPQTIVIQDNTGGGFMLFDASTGAYKCTLCEYGYDFAGIGSAKTDGCLITFSALGDGYTMTAYVSLCEQTAKCIVELTRMNGVSIQPFEEVLSDPDLRDSQATCGTVTPPPAPAIPAEIIVQNDVDGSFLLVASKTGEFKFIDCQNGTAMSGIGKVTMAGPWLNFEVMTDSYRVVASVNLETRTAKAAIDIFAIVGATPPFQSIISDADFTDNVPVCGAKK